jgi:predicted nucleic acid-binding protein
MGQARQNKRRLIRLEFDAADHLTHLKALAKKNKDRLPDFADLCLVRMSELFPKHSVVTVDSDFRVYRRNKRDVIPLICPPGR